MITLHQGDCLEYMHTLPTGSVDAVITDPPYSINTKSDGQGKLNPWADRVNAAFWYREWMGEARRILKPTGCLWSFLNWRSMTTFQKATDDLRWSIESVLVWDKCWIGPGGPRGLRPSYEMVGLWAMEDFAIEDRGIYDIQRFKWSSHKPTGHPAEKPIDLIKWLIEISTKPGAIVADFFVGSGTTPAACLDTGRDFMGTEIDPIWYEYCLKRIEQIQQQPQLVTQKEGF
jgi:site-specific DNA-methyltransferase (adenine-specific)